jgi:hypothetical protein
MDTCHFFPDLPLAMKSNTLEWEGYFLIPPPMRGPPFAAFAASSFLALASSACFFLNSLSVYPSVSLEGGMTSSSSVFSFLPALRGFSFPPGMLKGYKGSVTLTAGLELARVIREGTILARSGGLVV